MNVGDLAPDFELPADDGTRIRLSALRGAAVVLYFYPKADTPGCTVQACEMRDRIDDFTGIDVVVLGISPDPVKAVRRFHDRFDLNFRLLADEDHSVAERYGVWKEKTMFGNTFWGVMRTTFVIDAEGRISRILEKVDPQTHADTVLEAL